MIRFFILLVIISIGCNAQPTVKETLNIKEPFKVVGFYLGKGDDIEKYELNKLTHLIYCFTYLQGNKIGFKNTEDEETLKRIMAVKKIHPKLKILISFGGWGGCETCSDVFATDSGRKEFALSVKDMLIKYNADGIDMDWESPVIGGYKNHKASPSDKENFTLLIKELRKTLPATSEICFDANSFKEFLDVAINWKEVMPLVDFVNLMTYGLPTNKRGHTGHHTALYSSVYQTESIDKAILTMDSMGIPLNKIVIGAAFYSFVVQNVDSVNNGLGQTGKFKENVIYRTLQESYTPKQGYTYHWDDVAKAPYLYNKQEKLFITYDDRQSVTLKTNYALAKKLGGIMFWKLNGDAYTKGLLDAIDEEVKKGN